MSLIKDVFVMTLIGLSLLTCGCVSRLCRYDVHVKVKPDLASKTSNKYPPVEVHIVVLDAAASEKMAQCSMSEYWRPGRRPNDYDEQKKRMFFGEEKVLDQVFLNDELEWAEWKRIEEPKLWIIADLPGVSKDTPDDPRRLSLPLETTSCWFRWRHRIEICLSRERGVYYQSPDAVQAKKKQR